MISNSTFVIGGCRSGKSSHALKIANQISRTGKLFVATCVPRDEEMHQRVNAHKQARDRNWQTLEVPLDIVSVLLTPPKDTRVILIDCLTLWISNLLIENEDLDPICSQANQLGTAIRNCTCPVILVANEVGLGIVPDNRLARLFRDASGTVNQLIAATCERVVMTVAGIAVTIK